MATESQDQALQEDTFSTIFTLKYFSQFVSLPPTPCFSNPEAKATSSIRMKYIGPFSIICRVYINNTYINGSFLLAEFMVPTQPRYPAPESGMILVEPCISKGLNISESQCHNKATHLPIIRASNETRPWS